MAGKRAKKRKNPGRRAALIAASLLICALAALFGYGALNASLLRLRRAKVTMEDLPHAFDGFKILYLSDIDMCGWNTPEKASDAVNRLQSLQPDLLILGGDYNSTSLFDLLNGATDEARAITQVADRTSFFQYISNFSAPYGKYALASSDDLTLPGLADDLAGAGFQPLNGMVAQIVKDGQRLLLAGIGEDENPSASLNGSNGIPIHKGDCLIGATVSPRSFPGMMTIEAQDGGRLFDLALAGHTHGGQIRLLGRNVLSLTSQEQQYLSGWTRETGVPMLTTSGLGCEAANLRIGSQPEAWLITLVEKQVIELPDLS